MEIPMEPDYTYPILAVFISFLVLVTLILKLSADQFDYIPNIIRVRQQKPVVCMEKVPNPFSLLVDGELSESNKIHASIIRSQSQSEMQTQCIQMFWGVDIQEFHQRLQQIANRLAGIATGAAAQEGMPGCSSTVCDQNTLRNISLSHSDVVDVDFGDNIAVPVCVQSPRHIDIERDLGRERPRRRYPVVCTQWCTESESAIIGMISVIHIKDAIITDGTHVILQYVITRQGLVYPLEQLFVESDSAMTQDRDSSSGGQSDPLCIICQSNSSLCVILPCKHTCVCGRCMKKLDTCPMCRASILSYFSLTADDHDPSAQTNDQEPDTEPQPRTLWQRVSRWNDRLNTWLGMQ